MSKLHPGTLCVLCLAAACSLLQGEVGVYLHSAEPLDPQIQSAMQAETERLLSPAELPVAWRTASIAGESFEMIVVAQVEGSCSAVPAVAAGFAAGDALARTATTDGLMQPFASLDCNHLRRVLAPSLQGRSAHERKKLVGTALGRLLAHELRHIVLRDPGHAGTGAAQSCFTRDDLISEEFHFDSLTLAQLRPAPPPQERATGVPYTAYAEDGPSGR